MHLDAAIEALLFFKGEPVSIGYLSKVLAHAPEEIEAAIAILEEKLRERGIVLMRNNDEVLLGSSPQASEIIEQAVKEELSRDIGKAGLETLTIVLYKGPVTRADIDHIRGVNSTFILRNLLIRGLVEKIPHPTDQRSFMYQPTFELFQLLGVKNVAELPDRDTFLKELETFKTAAPEDDSTPETQPEEIPEAMNDENNEEDTSEEYSA